MTEHDGPRSPAEIPAGESTGDARVDDAVERLAGLDDVPVHDHAAVIESVHRILQDALAEEQD